MLTASFTYEDVVMQAAASPWPTEGPRCLSSASGSRAAARHPEQHDQAVCRRDDGAGARSRPRSNKDRPGLRRCPRWLPVGRGRSTAVAISMLQTVKLRGRLLIFEGCDCGRVNQPGARAREAVPRMIQSRHVGYRSSRGCSVIASADGPRRSPLSIRNFVQLWRNITHFARAAPDFDALQSTVRKRGRFLYRVHIITSVKFVDADRKFFRSDGKSAIVAQMRASTGNHV